ncbi:MAG: hypothetical protein RSE00_05660, partial [Clostridia bacterium]
MINKYNIDVSKIHEKKEYLKIKDKLQNISEQFKNIIYKSISFKTIPIDWKIAIIQAEKQLGLNGIKREE